MRMKYPAIQNAAMDREDDQNNVIPGEWHRGNTWEQELQRIHGNRETKAGKQPVQYHSHGERFKGQHEWLHPHTRQTM